MIYIVLVLGLGIKFLSRRKLKVRKRIVMSYPVAGIDFT